MKKLFFVLLWQIFLLSVTSFYNHSFASHKSFNDNFDDPVLSATQWITSGPQLFNGDGSPANWTFANGEYGMRIVNKGSQFNETIPKNWDINFKNYVMEVDMKLVNGVDTNLVFRYQDHDHWYGIHGINNANVLVFQKYGQPWNVIPPNATYHFTLNTFYHLRIESLGENLKVFINNQQIWDITDVGTSLLTGTPGLQASTGAVTSSEVWFDNSSITSIDDIEPPLDVPLLKQTSDPWQSDTYDSADIWSPNNPTIYDWGCAMTSAAMVLNYHGYDLLPDGTTLDPGSLNTWLNNEPDGYIGNGNINWLAISRLSEDATTVNNITSFEALEFERINSTDSATLKADIENNIPDILQQPGHFIVGTGVTDNSFAINDPFFNRTELSDGYSNTFQSLRRFTPSNTDLSYIMIVTDPTTTVSINNSSGNPVGQTFTEDPISNPNNPLQTNGSPLRIIYVQKPLSDIYNISVSSLTESTYNLGIYSYDQDGNVHVETQEGFIAPTTRDMISLDFDQQVASASSTQKTVTFQSTVDDISEAEVLNLIEPKTARTLRRLVQQAEEHYHRGHMKQSEMKLIDAQNTLDDQRSISISETAYLILTEDIDYLLNQLAV